MRLIPDALVAKWTARFAPNDQFRITAGDLQEFARDLADSFGVVLANVPSWVAGTTYAVGYLVRYSQAGGRESFYYSLVAGVLPHPTYNQSDATWKLVPGPVAEATLYQYLTLNEAQSIEGDSVVPGRRYGVTGRWNGSATDQVVYLDGLENYFRKRGTVLADGGGQQEVTVDVLAGTYAPVAAGGGGGSTDAVQLTNTGAAPYVDVFLDNPAAQLDGAVGLANYGGLQVQVLNPATNAAYATESAYLPDVQATLAAAWQTGVSRLLLRCQVLPLRAGLVAHARLTFTLAVTPWGQALAPHASAFRLFGTAFALQAAEWTHAAPGMQVSGSSLLNPGGIGSTNNTGSPLAEVGGGSTGLLAACEFTHNRTYGFDYIGLSDALQPSETNFAACFFIAGGGTWYARVGSTDLANGSLATSNFRFRLEAYDDHVNWLVDGTVVYTLLGSLTATQLWPAAKLGSNVGLTNCLMGGQVTSPR